MALDTIDNIQFPAVIGATTGTGELYQGWSPESLFLVNVPNGIRFACDVLQLSHSWLRPDT